MSATVINLRPRPFDQDRPSADSPAVYYGPVEAYDLSCTLPLSVWGQILALVDVDPDLATRLRASIGRHNPPAVIATDTDPTPARGLVRASRGGGL